MNLVSLFFINTCLALTQLSSSCRKTLETPLETEGYPLAILQAVDAMGKPVGILRGLFTSIGDFNACSAIDKQFDFDLILIEGSLVVNQTEIGSKLGLCLPKDCFGFSDVTLILSSVLGRKSQTPNFIVHENFNITDIQEYALIKAMSLAFSSMYNLYEDSEKIVHFDILKLHPHIRYEYTLGAIMVMIIIFILVIIVLVATILDFLKLNGKTTKETNPLEHVEIREGSKSSEVDTLLEKPTTRSTSKIFKLLYKIFNTVHRSPISVFSLYKTLPLLFNTKPSKFPQLNCLNLIRVISIYWVAAGHTYGSFVDLAPVDGLDILKSFKNPYFVILANSFFSVDTFFFLSSFLVGFMFFIDPTSLKKFNYIKYALMRFLRLSPAYFFIVFFVWFLTPLLNDGPLWIFPEKTVAACDKYWWTHLLYINNFYPEKLMDECVTWGWYLSADFHLYLIAPLFIIPLLYKNKTMGWIIMSIGIIICALVTIIPSIIYHVAALPTPTDSVVDKSQAKDSLTEWQLYFYAKSYNHLIVTLCGIISSYFAVKIKSMNQFVGLMCQLIGAGLMIAALFSPIDFMVNMTRWPNVVNALYNFFSRLCWSLGIGLLILPTVINPTKTRLLSTLFDWNGWVIIGRLNYCFYLVHCIVINVIYGGFLKENAFSVPMYLTIYGGVIFWSYVFALLLHLIIEVPFASLVLMLKTPKRNISNNVTSTHG